MEWDFEKGIRCLSILDKYKYMAYCLYLYIIVVLAHWLTKYLRRCLSGNKNTNGLVQNPLKKRQVDEREQNLNKLETEIQEIKTFLKELTQSSVDAQLIQQIQQQSGSIASIQQNFQKFATLQEEFQRNFLQTQTKMMSHLSKTLSQRTGSNNNQSISSIQRAELSFNQKQDSPHSQGDSVHLRSAAQDQSSILSQVNSNNQSRNHRKKKSEQSKVELISQELITEVVNERFPTPQLMDQDELLYTPQTRQKNDSNPRNPIPRLIPSTTKANQRERRPQYQQAHPQMVIS